MAPPEKSPFDLSLWAGPNEFETRLDFEFDDDGMLPCGSAAQEEGRVVGTF